MDTSQSEFSTASRTGKTRRGAMLPLIALLLPVVLLLMGFAVDLAYMQNTRMELRAATDAAARAAATCLSQTDSESEAIKRAKQVAAMNHVGGKPLQLETSDITVGRSEPDSGGRWVFKPGVFPPNAVQIEGSRTAGSAGGAVPLFFGSLIGRKDFEPHLSATASFLNVDICLVLDRSTSMKLDINDDTEGMYTSDSRFCKSPNKTSRWQALDGAVRVFTKTLRDSNAAEKVALVTYSSDLSGYKPALCGASKYPSSLDAVLTTDISVIDKQMDRLLTSVWNGNTYIESGMRTGLAEITNAERSRNYANKIMIVLTDGYENVGSARLAAQDCRSASVVVNAITFGDYADQATMEDVASIGGGRHYHATTSAGLEQIFRQLAAEIARITE
jgi:Ca-activated chloride channel family protein